MFSIKVPSNCKTKVVKTSSAPSFYILNNLVYTNTQLNSVPNIECIINSQKQKLTNDAYNPLLNPL